jgi:hypothetical protein
VYNEAYVRNELELRCLGKESCIITPTDFITRTWNDQKCTSKYSQFYTQVLCEHTDKQLRDRENIGIWMTCQAILTAIVYLIGIWYIKRSTSTRYEEWDQETTTISDYTVKYDVPSSLYDEFARLHEENSDRNSSNSDVSTQYEADSTVYAFQKKLKEEIEDKLYYMEPVTKDPRGIVTVSEINFIFENTDIINMLMSRGAALNSNNDEKAKKIEKKIKDYLRKNWKRVSTPKEAYVTFKTEEGYLRAVQLDATKICGKAVPKDTWRGEPFVLEQVQEPSNIYWENRHTSNIWKVIKQIITTLLLILVLAFFVSVLFYTQKVFSRLRREYPEVDCDDVNEGLVGTDMLKKFAMTEWFHWQGNDGSKETMLKLTTSNLQCYCDGVVEDKGRWEAMQYTLEMEIGGQRHTGHLCEDYLQASRIIWFISLAVPILIIVSNTVIKHASIILCGWIGFDKRTNEISMIQILCFFILFFNNALAILLINAKFGDLNRFSYLFDGDHEDFDGSWYRNVAPFIISPMYIQLIFPLQNLIPDVSIQQGLAWLDRRFTNPMLYKTNCKTAVQYAELNSGAEHLLFEKYPRLVNIVMLSMMYGFGIPIFLVLTLLSMILSYIIDKILVAYYHRKPPMYDDTLNKISVHFLKWGAFFYLAIAYWMISNKQMFGNVLTPKNYQDEVDVYHHYLHTECTYKYQSILKWSAIIVGLVMFIYDFFLGWLNMCKKSSVVSELLSPEDLLGKLF